MIGKGNLVAAVLTGLSIFILCEGCPYLRNKRTLRGEGNKLTSLIHTLRHIDNLPGTILLTFTTGRRKQS